MILRTLTKPDLLLELNTNNPNLVLSNGYLLEKAFFLPQSSIPLLNNAAVSKVIYEDYGSFAPAEVKMKNIADKYDSWMMKLFPKEDRETTIIQYTPAILIAPKLNFGREIREYLDLLFDNCIDFKLFQCYMSPDLPEHFTSRGKYIMHLIGQQLHIQYDEITKQDYFQKGDYIVVTLIRDTELF